MMKEIGILLSVVDGGVAINLSRSIGEKSAFLAFIHELLAAGGFDADPRTVNFERNKPAEDGPPKINWFRLRIPAEECRTHAVHPPTVVRLMAEQLEKRDTGRRHHLDIQLTVKGIPDAENYGRRHAPVPAGERAL